MNYKMSFQELAIKSKELLEKQGPVTLEQARAQAAQLKKEGEAHFLKQAPVIQNELLKLIKIPLNLHDKNNIYTWLFRKQITIEMLSEEVFDAFKQTKHYEKLTEAWS